MAAPASVLVVDDDENLLRMLRRGLAFAGYQVRMASDGEAALRVVLEQEPDLILLDAMLPEPLDGLEVARRLRAGGSNVPVLMLMLTARERLADKLAGFASGADDCVPKPFAFEELLARVAAPAAQPGLERGPAWRGAPVRRSGARSSHARGAARRRADPAHRA